MFHQSSEIQEYILILWKLGPQGFFFFFHLSCELRYLFIQYSVLSAGTVYSVNLIFLSLILILPVLSWEGKLIYIFLQIQGHLGHKSHHLKFKKSSKSTIGILERHFRSPVGSRVECTSNCHYLWLYHHFQNRVLLLSAILSRQLHMAGMSVLAHANVMLNISSGQVWLGNSLAG